MIKDSFHLAEEIVDQQHDLCKLSLKSFCLWLLRIDILFLMGYCINKFPLGSTVANACLVYHEKNWLECCPLEYRPLYYRRYVDDIFVSFNSPEHLKRFLVT